MGSRIVVVLLPTMLKTEATTIETRRTQRKMTFSQLSPLSPSLTIPKSTLTQTKTTETKALKAKAKPSLLNLHEKDSLTKKLRKNKQKSPRDPHRSSSARSSINDGDEIGRPRWSWSTHPDNNISSNNSKTSRTPSASKANLPPQIDVPIESTIVCGRCSSRRQLHERQPLLPDLVAALRDLRGPELLPSSAAVVPVYPIPPTAPFPQREQTVGIHTKQQQQGEDNVEREQGVDGPRSLSRSRSPSPSLADVATICHLARCSARGLAKHLSVDEATAQALSTALARSATAAKNGNDTNDSSVFQNTVDHSFARSASALSTASTTASRRNTPALPIAASVSPTTNHSVIADRTYYVLPMPVSRHISSTPEAAGTCVPHNSNSDRPRRSLSGADAVKEEEQKTICFNRDVLTSNASHQPPAAVVSHQHHYYYAIPPPAMQATSLSPMLSVLPPPSLLSSGASPQMLARPSLSQSEATKANTHNKHQEKGTENNDGDDKSNSDDNAFWLTREGNDSEHHSRSTRVSPLKGHTNSHNTRRSPSSNNSVIAYLGRKEGEQPQSQNATENQNEVGIPHTTTPPKIAIHNTLSSSDKKAQEKGRSRSVSSVGSMPRRCFSFAPLTSVVSRSAQAEALSRRCRYLGEPTEAEKERFAIARRKLKIQKEEEWQRRLQQPSGEATIEGRLDDFCLLKEKERSHSSRTPSQFLFVDNSEETKERVLRERREANAKGNAFIHSSRATALSKTPNSDDNAKAMSGGSPGTINCKTPQSNSRQQTVSTAESTPSDSDKNNTETNTILGCEDSGDSIEKREKATNNNELGISKNQNPPTIKRRNRVPKNNTFSYESSDGSEDRDDENHSSSRRRPSHPRPCSGSSREPSPKPRTGCALIPTSPPRMRPQ